MIWSKQTYSLYEEVSTSNQSTLIVSHAIVFRPLRNDIMWSSYTSWKQMCWWTIGYGAIVKLPTLKIGNELDQRILAEVYKMLAEVDTALETYELEPATKALMNFMEKLTNWYLRRSRRRFRATGMDADKQAAYATLREVLRIYLKVAAPFAPFVTESIWLEMGAFVTASETKQSHDQEIATSQAPRNDDSIHLQYRPLGSDKYINEELIDEIATVRKVIKGAMYLRAKHQIKVKQPLRELKFRS